MTLYCRFIACLWWPYRAARWLISMHPVPQTMLTVFLVVWGCIIRATIRTHGALWEAIVYPPLVVIGLMLAIVLALGALAGVIWCGYEFIQWLERERAKCEGRQ